MFEAHVRFVSLVLMFIDEGIRCRMVFASLISAFSAYFCAFSCYMSCIEVGFNANSCWIELRNIWWVMKCICCPCQEM